MQYGLPGLLLKWFCMGGHRCNCSKLLVGGDMILGLWIVFSYLYMCILSTPWYMQYGLPGNFDSSFAVIYIPGSGDGCIFTF